jgi:putative transposase
MASPQLPLEPGGIYHIYSHANGSENLFRVEDNYRHFLKKYFQYIQPAAGTYAYCLMPNHFHAMIHVHDEEKLTKLIKRKSKSDDQIEYPKLVSWQISHFLNGYTQAYNKMFGRMGSLFIPNFKRRKVETSDYFIRLVTYIHNNPIKHGFVKNLSEWTHSSWHDYTTNRPTKILKAEALEWFGSHANFMAAHSESKFDDYELKTLDGF